jgi:uncharacterized protein
MDIQRELADACFNGKLDLVELLISQGADINTKSGNYPPLIVATQNGQTAVVKLLLSKKVDVLDSDNNYHFALYHAVKLGHSEIAELLINADSWVDEFDNKGWTLLMYAICKENLSTIAELLILKGADINKKNDAQETAFILACECGRTSIAELLILKGADVNARHNPHGENFTPLLHALRNGHPSTAEMLISKGADVNAKDGKGGSPLVYAKMNRLTKTAELLISKGADVNAKESGYATITTYIVD